MNDRTERLVSQMPVTTMDALEISGERWRNMFKWKSYEVARYPDLDICYDIIHSKKFDIIFAEQVFEHLRYPYRAARNVCRMLNPGGRFLVTTPFLIHVHGVPMDYTRWTPDGMKYLLEEAGFDVDRIVVGSWGNIACAVADLESCAKGTGWINYDPALHSLENDPRFASSVWAIAQSE
jgi:SAM-dependent methyltransferase